ncbi:MAG: cytochrome c [Rhodospirillales bacterium]|nr:cytochrome c [Rhodospirillales bacterium]
MNVNWAALAIGALVIGGVVVSLSKIGADAPSGAQSTQVAVQVPGQLTLSAQRGQVAFNATCAACHGENASGTDQGPPLIHDIYNPGHHADGAFFLAAKRGVRAHHWPYGDMPAQPHVSDGEIAAIVAYVRELQIANGIVTRPHNM